MRNVNENAIDLELEMARNEWGEPLTNEAASLIKVYLVSPSLSLWSTIANTVVACQPLIPLWSAVCAVDPSFQRSCRTLPDGRIEGWREYPSPAMVREALRFATH